MLPEEDRITEKQAIDSLASAFGEIIQHETFSDYLQEVEEIIIYAYFGMKSEPSMLETQEEMEKFEEEYSKLRKRLWIEIAPVALHELGRSVAQNAMGL
jgi:hypothetical protein